MQYYLAHTLNPFVIEVNTIQKGTEFLFISHIFFKEMQSTTTYAVSIRPCVPCKYVQQTPNLTREHSHRFLRNLRAIPCPLTIPFSCGHYIGIL